MAKNDFLKGLLEVTGNMIQHKADAQKERVQFQALMLQNAFKNKMEIEQKKAMFPMELEQEKAKKAIMSPSEQQDFDLKQKFMSEYLGQGNGEGQAATTIAEPPDSTQSVAGAPVTPAQPSSMPFGGDVNRFANSMRPTMRGGKVVLDRPSAAEIHNFLVKKQEAMPESFNTNDKAIYAGLNKKLYGVEYGAEGVKKLSPSMQKLKAQDTKEYLDTINSNQAKLGLINEVKQIIDTIPQGMIGKGEIALMGIKGTDPKLENIQKVKMVLTDAQLLNTAKTKGAISDKEMELFSEAAANDNFSSPRIKPVLNKLVNFMEADAKSKREAYIRNYGEDPEEAAATPKPLSFNSEQEVMAAGLPSGTPIIINGRQAIWE